jgi:hypothetical protein
MSALPIPIKMIFKYRYVLSNMNHKLKYLLRQHFFLSQNSWHVPHKVNIFAKITTIILFFFVIKSADNTVPHLRHVRQFPLGIYQRYVCLHHLLHSTKIQNNYMDPYNFEIHYYRLHTQYVNKGMGDRMIKVVDYWPQIYH